MDSRPRAPVKEYDRLAKPEGVLAVQIPMNFNEPIHIIIQELAASPKWKEYFNQKRKSNVLKPGEYYDILSEISEEFYIWETIYYHTMKSHKDILEWYRGTGLRPYLNALPEDKRAEFENEVLRRLIIEYPKQKNGDVIFRFPRFFFIAYPKLK